MQTALREAGLANDEIEMIKAHGSSTPLNDKTETIAIKLALGPAATSIPVMATKGHHGHALGASGAWELILALQSMRDRKVPQVANLTNDDPECDLSLTRRPLDLHARTALANTTGFGGINAALVLREVVA
jgi:3-oxoacyl-(acyl-carrier-protein) synthase